MKKQKRMLMRARGALLAGAVVAAGAMAPEAAAQANHAKLTAYWNFNNADPAVAADVLHGIKGTLTSGAVFSADLGGRTGAAGDLAMDFGPSNAGQRINVPNAGWLNKAAAADVMTVSYWQKLSAVAASSAFWMVSPSSSGTQRGFQAHSPWSDRNVYYDTAGCCAAGTQRLSAGVDLVASGGTLDLTQWHHFVFVKNGFSKQIYVDGILLTEAFDANPLPMDMNRLVIGAEGGGGNSMRGWLDDFAIYGGALSQDQITALVNGASPASLDADTDGDGMPDWWEEDNNFNKASAADASQDADNDGSTNLQEYVRLTDPRNEDTDGDGLKDGVETGTGVWVGATDTGTNPLAADTDGDGLLDGVESNTGTFVSKTNTGTNPHLKDTDGDLFPDGTETMLGSSPVLASAIPVRAGRANLLAFWNFNNSSVPEAATDVVNGFTGQFINNAFYTFDAGGRSGQAGDKAVDFGPDSTGQRMSVLNALWLNAVAPGDKMTVSFWQWHQLVANATTFWMQSPSSGGGRGAGAHVPWGDQRIYWDTAGCCDGNTQRISQNISALNDPEFDFHAKWHHYVFVKNGPIKQIWVDGKLLIEGRSTNPLPADFISLTVGADSAGGGSAISYIDDFAVFASALDSSYIIPLSQGVDPIVLLEGEKDSDSDGMPDLYEDVNGFDKLNAADGSQDADSDGLTNVQEYTRGTNPRNPDSDGDGAMDGVETGTGIWVSASNRGTNPLNPDSDGDGLKDGVESNTGTFVDATNTGTSPLAADSDGDGVADGVEIALKTSPVDPNQSPVKPGGVNLLAWWNFNNASNAEQAVDVARGFVGMVEGGALYTADAGGRSGLAGDKAMDFGFGGGTVVRVPDAVWVNAASPADAMSVSLWVQLYEVSATSAFWFRSPSSNNGQRGFQAHIPWSNNRLYFDTTGCCDGGLQRIDQDIFTLDPAFNFLEWHHYVFVKNGARKEIWVDGRLFHSGSNTLPLPSDINNIMIGSSDDAAGSIHGIIDDFAVFASGLTEAQVNELHMGVAPNALTEALLPFNVTGAAYDSGAKKITLTWESRAGASYTVQRASDWSGWTDVATVAGAAGSTSYTDDANSTAAYYRIKAQ